MPAIHTKQTAHGFTAWIPELGLYGAGHTLSTAMECLRMAHRAKFGTELPG